MTTTATYQPLGTTNQSFEQLSSRAHLKIKRFALAMCRNIQDAEDITQEAMVRAFRAFDRFKHDSSFETWVMRIAQRLYYDLMRKRKRLAVVPSLENDDDMFSIEDKPDDSLSPEDIVVTALGDPILSEAFQALTNDQQMLVRWLTVEEQSYRDTADRLGIPLGTVKSRYHRALHALKQHYMRVQRQRTLTANRSLQIEHA